MASGGGAQGELGEVADFRRGGGMKTQLPPEVLVTRRRLRSVRQWCTAIAKAVTYRRLMAADVGGVGRGVRGKREEL